MIISESFYYFILVGQNVFNLHYEGFFFPSVPVCWMVGLSAGLHKNYFTDFNKTWMEDGSQPMIDPTNFEYKSGITFFTSAFFIHLFIDMLVISLGNKSWIVLISEYNLIWILIKINNRRKEYKSICIVFRLSGSVFQIWCALLSSYGWFVI